MGMAKPFGQLSVGAYIVSKLVLDIEPVGVALGVSWRRPRPTLLCVSAVSLTSFLQSVGKGIFVN